MYRLLAILLAVAAAYAAAHVIGHYSPSFAAYDEQVSVRAKALRVLR